MSKKQLNTVSAALAKQYEGAEQVKGYIEGEGAGGVVAAAPITSSALPEVLDITPAAALALGLKPDADQNADIIAAFYAGKKLGALELCSHLENNWGAECAIAAQDWRAKLDKVQA